MIDRTDFFRAATALEPAGIELPSTRSSDREGNVLVRWITSTEHKVIG